MKAFFLSAIFIVFAVLVLTLLPVGLKFYEYEQQERALRIQSEEAEKLRQQNRT